jgi:hypothetical protein
MISCKKVLVCEEVKKRFLLHAPFFIGWQVIDSKLLESCIIMARRRRKITKTKSQEPNNKDKRKAKKTKEKGKENTNWKSLKGAILIFKEI